MIDVENLWTSDSPVENLHTVINAFYDFMCNKEEFPFERILKLDDKHDFAFRCKRCGEAHAEHGRVWARLAVTIKENYPSEDHPEYQEYFRVRKEFMENVKHIDVRDYAEPFLRASAEGAFIALSMEKHAEDLKKFEEVICSSNTIPENDAMLGHLVEFDCSVHETKHYLTPQQNNHHRAKVNGAHVPAAFVDKLSKLSQRIVLRDTSSVYRDFQERFPSRKVENVLFKERLEERKQVKAKRREKQEALEEKKRLRREHAKITQKKAKKRTQTETGTAVVCDPNLYILKPSLVSDEWFVEYHICGRKVAYETFADAFAYKRSQGQEEYGVYACPYGSHWHYGRKGNKTTYARQIKSGKRWYNKDYKKANAFIHKIMLEEF